MSESNVRASDDRVSCCKMLECMIWTVTGVMQKPRSGWRRHSPSVALLVAALAAGILFPSGAVYADTMVNIDNFTFAPQALTVKAGTTVIWRNEDDIPHTVASTKRVFKSKALDTNDSFSFTFTEPGSYEYFCSLHPHMTGKIVVEPATRGPAVADRRAGGIGRTQSVQIALR